MTHNRTSALPAYGLPALGLRLSRVWGAFLGVAVGILGSVMLAWLVVPALTEAAEMVPELFASDDTPVGTYVPLIGILVVSAGLILHCAISVFWIRAAVSKRSHR